MPITDGLNTDLHMDVGNGVLLENNNDTTICKVP